MIASHRHDTPILVIPGSKTGAGAVYAGAGQDRAAPPMGAVILDLARKYDTPTLTGANLPPTLARALAPILTVPRLTLEWPDMGLPRMGTGEWFLLSTATRGRALFVACMIGHGRTGTALAILAALRGAVPRDADPVAWVRAHYCPSAVETDEQARYVARITGHTVTARGSQPAPSGVSAPAGAGSREKRTPSAPSTWDDEVWLGSKTGTTLGTPAVPRPTTPSRYFPKH